MFSKLFKAFCGCKSNQTDTEVAAAIAVALYLSEEKQAPRAATPQENRNTSRSAWNSKQYGMRQIPVKRSCTCNPRFPQEHQR